MLAGPPTPDEPVPLVVTKVAGGDVPPVWENEVGGLTFAVGGSTPERYIKWAPAGSGIDLEAEADRLRWAGHYTSVPAVIDSGRDHDGAWLMTTALAGDNAVSPRWRAEPANAVRAIGRALRRLHDELPVAGCPFSWTAADRVAEARSSAAAGLLDPARWHSVHQQLSIEDALSRLTEPPEVDVLVVCHGDACAPNTILREDGSCSGHVDLGWLGVADRWADLAVATWSADWNYGPGWEDLLLESYGVSADRARSDYYRLLWDLGP